MFEDVPYKTKIMAFIAFLVLIIGCMMYFMKDTLFPPPKKVTFDPVVTEKAVDKDSDDYFFPSKTFTGRKPGYVFTLRDEGQGYYRDELEM